jgi:hypothetical protein
MLSLTGRLGDGWLPSVGEPPYLGEADIAERWKRVDDAAAKAGRDPGEIVRAVNLGLHDAERWLDPSGLASFLEAHPFDVVLLAPDEADPVRTIRRFAEDVVPALPIRPSVPRSAL